MESRRNLGIDNHNSLQVGQPDSNSLDSDVGFLYVDMAQEIAHLGFPVV